VLLLSPIHFFSCSAVTPFSRCCYPFPGTAQADLVLFAAAVLTAGLLSFPCGFLFTTSIFPWVGTGRPCALRSRGFNRQVTDPIFPLCFSFYPHRLPCVGADRPCALRSRGFNRRSPPTRCSPHRLDDSFRFVFFNSIHWLSKFYMS
jgi:hypothetical protein